MDLAGRRDRPRCGSCDYWEYAYGGPGDEDDPAMRYGHCHRRPPEANPREAELRLFPLTFEVDWCGEHPDFLDYLRDRDLGRLKEPG